MSRAAQTVSVDSLVSQYHAARNADEKAYHGVLIAVRLGGLSFDMDAANRWHDKAFVS